MVGKSRRCSKDNLRAGKAGFVSTRSKFISKHHQQASPAFGDPAPNSSDFANLAADAGAGVRLTAFFADARVDDSDHVLIGHLATPI